MLCQAREIEQLGFRILLHSPDEYPSIHTVRKVHWLSGDANVELYIRPKIMQTDDNLRRHDPFRYIHLFSDLFL